MKQKENCGLHLRETHFSLVKMKNKIINEVLILPHEKLATISLKNVAIALSDENVIAKILKLNGQLSEIEIQKHLHLESRHYFGYESGELYFDFKILQYDLIKKHTAIYVVASRRKEIFDKIMHLQKYHITIRTIDIESLAIARAVQFFHEAQCINYFYFDVNKAVFTVLHQNSIYSRLTKLPAPLIEPDSVSKVLNQNIKLYLNLENTILSSEIILVNDVFLKELYLTENNRPINGVPLQLYIQKTHPHLLEKNKLTEFITALGLALWK